MEINNEFDRNEYLNKDFNLTIYFDKKSRIFIFDAINFFPSPGDELLFNVTDGKADITQFIKLTNTSGVYLAYKVTKFNNWFRQYHF